MPRTYEMSWEGAPKYRWVKMFKGRRFRVSCEELKAMVWTKDASAPLANAWWTAKQAELAPYVSPVETIIQNMATDRHKLASAAARGMVAERVLAAMPVVDTDQAAEKIIGKHKTENRLDVLESYSALLGADVPATDQTLAFQAERYLTTERLRAKKAGTFGDLADYIRRIQKEAKDILPLSVKDISSRTVTDFYAWLRTGSGWAGCSQQKVFGYFRRLVRFLWSEGHCELPRNLDARTFTFDSSPKAVKRYATAEIRKMLATMPPRLKLYALLSLNCGMYGVDMGCLKKTEYTGDRITRKRTKTERTKDVPTVEYQLWPETKALLDLYPSTHPELVLTSMAGTPLWKVEIREGKRIRVDLIHVQWNRGRGEGRAARLPIPLKALRSVSATALESHPIHRRYVGHFLGHSPKTLAERHYAAPDQAGFDQALVWLRKEILGE